MLWTLSQTQRLAKYFGGLETVTAWLDLLRLIFPFIKAGRVEQARTSYEYFHSEHERVFGYSYDYVFSDDDYQFEWLVDDLEDARKKFLNPDEDRAAAQSKLMLHVARVVENGGRKAMIYAVDQFEVDRELNASDGDGSAQEAEDFVREVQQAAKPAKTNKRPRAGTSAIKGWARVPTGAETCGWCLMLCSRGPVYLSAYSAGLDLEDRHALADFDAGQGVDADDMDEWHPGCDCKVVPVFDTRTWPGKAEADDALEVWREATKLAERELRANPNKKSFVGGRWVPTTLNREAINQMRRLLGDGY